MSAEFKDLLLKDYDYRSEAMWKNEQGGETRVNLFIGFVTLAVGLGSALVKESDLDFGQLLLVVLVGLVVVLVVGCVTFQRMITRNINTDQAKVQLDVIRQTFKDHFADEGAFTQYTLFPTAHKPDRKSNARRFGGLAHTVGAINALLCAGIATVIVLLVATWFGEAGCVINAVAALAAVIVFCTVFRRQIRYADDEEERAKDAFRSGLLPTHAGGVVYELRDGKPYYLMISPKGRKNEAGGQRQPDEITEWVLPKGHIEKGEDHREAALREVQEETGIVARLGIPLGRVKFNRRGENQDAKFYLMEKIYDVPPKPDENRHVDWAPFRQAVERLRYEESRQLVREAERHLQMRFRKSGPEGAQTRSA